MKMISTILIIYLFSLVSFLILFLTPLKSHASVDKKPAHYSSENHHPSAKNFAILDTTKITPIQKLKLVRRALQLPSQQRIQSLKKMPWTEDLVTQIAFDRKYSLTERWKSLTALGQLNPQNQVLEKAVQHKDWFMRNAGILAMSQGPRKRAIKWSRKLLEDPALVVRTAAVKVIHNLNARELEDILWKKLKSKENFKSGESLWIRKHIVKALSDFSQPGQGQEARFVSLLNDKDSRVHQAAIQALEKITNSRFEGETITQQRQAWLSWWKKRPQTSDSSY